MPLIKENPRSIYAESFRTIKTNIKYSSVDENKKVLMITSAGPEEGKSNTAMNLAVSLSEDNKKVLLIDCDLRRPTIHKIFNISNLKGLTDVLIGDEELEKAIGVYDLHLDILPSGNIPPNPAELLASDCMDSILKELKFKYDYIIIDTPPLGLVSDSQILTSRVDGVILVARYEKTKKDKLIECKKIIDQVNGKLIGVVINRVKGIKNKNYYYY